MEQMSKREKIMLGVAVASVAAAGYFGYKYSGIKTSVIKEELASLKFLVVESDCIPKAIQNAENKLARKETKIKAMCKALNYRPGDRDIKAAIVKHEKDAAKLRYQINKAFELHKRVIQDEIVY